MKKIIFVFSFLLSLSTLASGGLEKINLAGNLRFELGGPISTTKSCVAIESLPSGRELDEFMMDHTDDLASKSLSSVSKVFACPVAGTSGRMNEFIYIVKNAANKNILVLATPFVDYTFEVVASELGKLYLGLNDPQKNGALLINPETQAQ